MKNVGLRLSPRPPSAAGSSEGLRAHLPGGLHLGRGNPHGIGRPQLGTVHADNTQMGCDQRRSKDSDTFEKGPWTPGKVLPRPVDLKGGSRKSEHPPSAICAARGPGVGTRGGSDNVALGNQCPPRNPHVEGRPVKGRDGHRKPGDLLRGHRRSLHERLSFLRELFGRPRHGGKTPALPRPVHVGGKWFPIKTGLSSADNVSKHFAPTQRSTERRAVSEHAVPLRFQALRGLGLR